MKDKKITKKIEQFAIDSLSIEKEKEIEPSSVVVPNGEWTKIRPRKWEFRWNGVILATIFHKPTNNKFSLWVTVPNFYKKSHTQTGETYQYETFDDAIRNFPILLKRRAQDWCAAVSSFFSHHKIDEMYNISNGH